MANEIKKTMKSVDGNTAAALASYNFTEVASIYPITPSSISRSIRFRRNEKLFQSIS